MDTPIKPEIVDEAAHGARIRAISYDARLLIDALRRVQVGEVITYEDLNEIVGRDVRNGAKHILATARRRCQKDESMVFEAVTRVGLKRLDDGGIVQTAEPSIRRVRSAARRGAAKLICVQDFDNLTLEQKTRHNAAAAVMAAIVASTTRPSIKRIEAATKESQSKLPTAETLKLLAR